MTLLTPDIPGVSPLTFERVTFTHALQVEFLLVMSAVFVKANCTPLPLTVPTNLSIFLCTDS